MKTKEEVIKTCMDDYKRKVPSVEGFLKSHLDGIWENGYANGYAEGRDNATASYQWEDRRIENEIFQDAYNAGMQAGWELARRIIQNAYPLGQKNIRRVFETISAADADALFKIFDLGKENDE